ncbi:MAG: response regulator [Rhodobacterales bacterium]|nr:response regulator [Rhodobacterales bacterium]
MPLRTVRVPPSMQEMFERAEDVVAEFFQNRKDMPENGSIEICGERYVLLRAGSLSVDFFSLVRGFLGPDRESEADEFSRALLFDLAHAVGKSDARNFIQTMNLDDPVARLSAGPVHFAHTGWANVEILPESKPSQDADFYLLYDHPYSFDSAAWVDAGERSDFPVCIMNSGYSSGWCAESFGIELVASEVQCRAHGDLRCRFVMAPPERIAERAKAYLLGVPELQERAHLHRGPDFFVRKRLEDEVRASRRNLEERVRERTEALHEANQRLRQEMAEREVVERMLSQSQKMEALGRLSGGIAHDFNNLLSVIGGYAELIVGSADEAGSSTRYAQAVLNSVDRAADLTQQLLTFSKRNVVDATHVDVGDVVVRLGTLLQRLIGEDVELVIKTPDRSLVVQADRSQLEQLLLNLVVNARDAISDSGLIRVEVDVVTLDVTMALNSQVTEGSWIEIRVVDTGSGMTDEVLSRAFDPFFSTKPIPQASGLGLATVYGVVEQLGGGVRVRTAVGEGTTFHIYLPISSGEPRNTEDIITPNHAPRVHSTILLVEDEAPLREMLHRMLETRGYQVLVAVDGEAAVAAYERFGGDVSLLLTDVVMPGFGGVMLAQRLRLQQPTLRCLYMSGYADDREGLQDSLNSRTRFIQKPFKLELLDQQIQLMLATTEDSEV